MHADGTHRVALPPSSHAGFSWSPDSKLIAFVGTTPGDILVVRPNGTGVVRILHQSGSDYILRSSSTGRHRPRPTSWPERRLSQRSASGDIRELVNARR